MLIPVFQFSDTLEGYIHLLSKVKPSSNVFDCYVQTDQQTVVKAKCFSPDKRTNLHQAYKNKSPVKIKGFKSAGKMIPRRNR